MPATGDPAAAPSTYRVQRGETVWRIAQTFGIDVSALMRANRLRDASELRAGQVLRIPLPQESNRFLWPARGKLTRGRRPGVAGAGLEIRALEGSYVRASRTGQVAVAAVSLGTVGKTVILDHGDGYATVYCGLDQLLVQPGMQVRQGAPVGRLGRAPLYFEVRYQARVHDPLRVLP